MKIRLFIDEQAPSPRPWPPYPAFAELLLFCLPALLVGLALRVVLTIQLPYGHLHFDTADFLITIEHAIEQKSFYIHDKKAFLTPLFFAIPFLLHIPALLFIPAAQHFMGLIEVLFSGALVRLWFRHWKWFVVPVTLAVSANPFNLWYEHTLLGEANYLFFVFATALAGTAWAKYRGAWTFAVFVLCLFLTAGTRAEGFIFFLFGVLLVPFSLWPAWRRSLALVAAVLGAGFVASLESGGGHAPSLLYASLIDLTPDHPRSVPGIEPYVIPLRDRLRARWTQYPADLVQTAKDINTAIEPYVKARVKTHRAEKRETADVFKLLCLDIFLAHPVDVLLLPIEKFHLAIDGWSSGVFDQDTLVAKEEEALTRGDWMSSVISKGLTGRQMTQAEFDHFIEAKANPARVAWLAWMQNAWSRTMLFLRFPDKPAVQRRWVHDFRGGVLGGMRMVPGWPSSYLLAFLGMALAMIRPSPMRRVQIAWVLTLLAVMYAATLVGVTNARFRFGYEPFCWIYLFMVIDLLWPPPHAQRTV